MHFLRQTVFIEQFPSRLASIRIVPGAYKAFLAIISNMIDTNVCIFIIYAV